MTKKIEVFQDMEIIAPVKLRNELRDALITASVVPWSIDLDRMANAKKNSIISEDVILFKRESDAKLPAAGLTLWGTEKGYYVPNIVPLETGKLTYTQYNTILDDFIVRIALPVSSKFGFKVERSESEQTIDDWLSPRAVIKLKSFSNSANKSTLASHPLDQRRWFDFIITAYLNNDKLKSDMLSRWLYEVDGWDENSAIELAGNFENSISLLTYYSNYKKS